jgi:O-methyltransferase involved in polyketide biosynthesis
MGRMTTGKVHFTEDQSTNLATLYGRAMDAGLPEPVLGDPTAADAVRRIDYDFGKFKLNADLAFAIAARAKVFDDRAAEFLREHPGATVLHLGCGMDSRVFRLDPPPDVRWFDVDFPEVIALRQDVYPESARDGYTMLASSVTDLGWLNEIPADKPALVLAEGLTMYLDPVDGEALLRAIATHFPEGGEMMFDFYSKLGIKLQKANPVVRKAGATLRWGVNDPRELEKLGLTLVSRMTSTDFVTPDVQDRLSRSTRLQYKLVEHVRAFREMGQVVRYRF